MEIWKHLGVGLLGAALLTGPPDVCAMTPEERAMVVSLAERGNAGAQVLLGLAYLHGDTSLSRDDRQGASWLEKAAVQGDAYAQMRLADLYETGRGVPPSLTIAADWREKAANRGNVRAQASLGKMYLEGRGVPQADAKAEYWLTRAALEGDDPEAQFLLATLHRSARVASPNPELANNLLARSAARSYEDAVKLLELGRGIGYAVEESLHQRVPHLRKLAADGDPETQYQLALRLENDLFATETTRREAVDWYRRAAEGGNRMAMLNLARIYENGLYGVPLDAGEAGHWRRRAEEAPR